MLVFEDLDGNVLKLMKPKYEFEDIEKVLKRKAAMKWWPFVLSGTLVSFLSAFRSFVGMDIALVSFIKSV
jgi:hypothetical protein